MSDRNKFFKFGPQNIEMSAKYDHQNMNSEYEYSLANAFIVWIVQPLKKKQDVAKNYKEVSRTKGAFLTLARENGPDKLA